MGAKSFCKIASGAPELHLYLLVWQTVHRSRERCRLTPTVWKLLMHWFNDRILCSPFAYNVFHIFDLNCPDRPLRSRVAYPILDHRTIFLFTNNFFLKDMLIRHQWPMLLPACSCFANEKAAASDGRPVVPDFRLHRHAWIPPKSKAGWVLMSFTPITENESTSCFRRNVPGMCWPSWCQF